MIERHVRVGGRPVYGRAMPLAKPAKRRGVRRPKLSGLQTRLVVLVGLVLVVGWGISQLFAVTKIQVEAPARGPEIEAAATKLVGDSWRWGNLLTFEGGEFGAKLQDADPALRDVTVKRKWPHTIIVQTTLKQPSMGWSTGNQLYVLDRDGTVIGTATGKPALNVVHDGSNLPVQVGQRVVSANFITFVNDMVPALAASSIGVVRWDIKDTTLDLSAQTNLGYRLLFDTNRGAAEEVADLQAVQRLLQTQKRTPAEYIDLRVAGKAYYK